MINEIYLMQMLFAVFIGGGLGSICRWLISQRLNPLHHAIPMGTLSANLLGAFIIGIALASFSRLTNLDPMWKLLITTGFCGGLTTFSTFSSEVVFLLQDGRLAWAATNVVVNLAGSLIMTGLAFWLVSVLAAR
ncbi:fluoride efflux transporter CrcB [Mangrovibacter plantisponsor]|nr:fluoride efflux transporter CrcB [Mangrovibacter plantisponsor]